jgi:hypothetical protein
METGRGLAAKQCISILNITAIYKIFKIILIGLTQGNI